MQPHRRRARRPRPRPRRAGASAAPRSKNQVAKAGRCHRRPPPCFATTGNHRTNPAGRAMKFFLARFVCSQNTLQGAWIGPIAADGRKTISQTITNSETITNEESIEQMKKCIQTFGDSLSTVSTPQIARVGGFFSIT